MHFYIACEDQLTQACCIKLLKSYLPHCGFNLPIITGGCGDLKKKIDPFIRLSFNLNFATLILTDLDLVKDVESLMEMWLGDKNYTDRFIFIVAVKEIESWLLADNESLSKWSNIPKNKILLNPDEIGDIKQHLLNLIAKHGRKELKRDLLPSTRCSTSKVGIGYNSQLIHFVESYWNPEVARSRSSSLENALNILEKFGENYS